MRTVDDALLFQIAGFLNVQVQGLVPVPTHVKKEASEILEKVGAILAKSEEPKEEPKDEVHLH